ncbi:putative R-linalool synthase [Helianthus annuus]|uniref:R-linalool synthase QH1, chloroplastic n=1 Tax=Helianthus annuus TaxID=4232 RepID=UPI000B8F23F8|nr:R-linalool synthase QH1, chloroplastic [Helianthus annuus]KAJ0476582.1 putative R-linalool synthase [Helianthus annuus]KAJ0480838.1 putative R-linalool synthase [Helianthus annuus]KAJ0848862.1 putative R-linalool synthase [Helianthus annuus]
MALVCLFPCSLLLRKDSCAPSRRLNICKTINSSQNTSTVVEPLVKRRTANYESSLWSYDHVQSLTTKYSGKDYTARAENLKEVVKTMLQKRSVVENPLISLELVDDLQRLGIAYHFKEEIADVLENIYHNTRNNWSTTDLNLRSLGFRLLRQHGYPVSQDIFGNFKNKIENLNPCQYEDMVAILNLYEASYHSFEDESVLDEARDLTKKYLEENLDDVNGSIAPLVSHALEVPLQWRVPRVEARWFIDLYEKRSDMNPVVIELAKLDFDMVQAVHIEDLKHASRWWRNTSWDKKLTFARDRLVECFLWTVGYSYMPGFSTGRREITKVNAMITTIDDVYDVYGTLDELEQFTDVISRWDINAIEELPEYMKICFLGLYNTTNNVAYDTLINSRIHVLPYLKKAWADLCESYLREARWYHSRHTPTLKDYLNNACVTIGSPLTLMYMKILTSVTSTEEIVQWFEESKNIVNHTSLIVRLADDLETSSDEMKRGDIPKSIQCYMHESGATEEEARRHIKNLILKIWKKLNKERANAKSQLLHETIDYAMDIVRMAQFMYGKGDGHGRPNVTKSHVLSLLFNPIQET